MANEKDVIVESENNEVDGGNEVQDETITVRKSDYEKLNQTLGSLKRENKDLKKPKEVSQETTEKTTSDDSRLLEKVEKLALKTAGITHAEDVELARKTAKKWGIDIDEVLGDEDFKVKLERQQALRSNADATANVQGSSGSSAKTADYYIAKGELPPKTPENRKLLVSIARELMKKGRDGGGKFYNS